MQDSRSGGESRGPRPPAAFPTRSPLSGAPTLALLGDKAWVPHGSPSSSGLVYARQTPRDAHTFLQRNRHCLRLSVRLSVSVELRLSLTSHVLRTSEHL